jgi:hypothetical protein
MSELETLVRGLGQSLVACKRSCDGIVCNDQTGQIPRCLFLETAGRSGTGGAVVVGLNPGRALKIEAQYYVDRGCTYESVVHWFQEAGSTHGLHHPYYRRLRGLLDDLELRGSILWTELVKCESGPDVTSLPLQTLRTCTGEFLQAELELPQVRDWPLFGIGGEAYKGLAYRFPKRTVVGVPHPTGSHGQFAALFENRRLRESIAMEVKAALSIAGKAVWLAHGDDSERAV